MEETKIIYHIDDEDTPYLIKLPISSDRVTLGDFKNALNRPAYKFFFKSMDDDFGVVKEEIIDDDTHLPCFNGRVVSWLVPAENSASDTQSQCTESQDPSHLPSERVGGIGDSRPPSFHANASGVRDDNCDTCTETDSVLSSRRDRRPPPRPHPKDRLDGPRVNGHNKLDRLRDPRHYDTASSVLTSELESTSFFDSEDDMSSRFSTTTETTTRSSKYGRHRRRRRRHRLPPISRASSFSSITDSTMSLNIITVTVNLDTVNFLGISIVGQSNKGADGGIYVGSIMKGGAIAQDGRIEPGDMILEVNGISFENMSNDDAVRTLREAVQKPGPITLVVAKCWDPTPKGYFTIPRQEPVRPIDPSAWVAHTTAMRAMNAGLAGQVAPSMSQITSGSSVTGSSLPESENSQVTEGYDEQMHLSIDMDMSAIVKAMMQPDSGLEIRDRMWLKITIPNAFIGSDLVDWLFSHVEGFADRRDARKYACNLLKANFIRHTVNKITFSEQCYYIFGDLIGGMSALNLDDGLDSVSEADRDTLAPLPPPAWNNQYMAYSNSNFSSSYASMPYNYGGTETVSYGALPPREGSAGSVHSGSALNTCACLMNHTYKHIRKLWTNKEKEDTAQQRALLRTSPCNHGNSSGDSGSGLGNGALHHDSSCSSGSQGSRCQPSHGQCRSNGQSKRNNRSTASEESSASGSSSGKKKEKKIGGKTSPGDSGTDTDAASIVSVQHRTPSGSSDPQAPLLPPPPVVTATQSESSFRMAMGNP